MTLRLMLADDHRMLREGLARALRENGMDVIGEARDGDEAIQLATVLRPDVILMDVTMPNIDGIEATRQISQAMPGTKIVMLTMHADRDVFGAAVRAGAVGYLVKDCSTSEIIDAINMAASGEPALSLQLAASMLDEVRRLEATNGPDGDHGGAGAMPEHAVTPREVAVLQLIVDGLSTAEISEKLFISPKTVKNHLAAIYVKLESRDRTEAVMTAVRMGIVHLDLTYHPPLRPSRSTVRS